MNSTSNSITSRFIHDATINLEHKEFSKKVNDKLLKKTSDFDFKICNLNSKFVFNCKYENAVVYVKFIISQNIIFLLET